MKIEFKNESEKECLKHILFDWFTHNGDYDVLGCEPACRDASSPGCDWCLEKVLDCQLERNEINFLAFGDTKWIMDFSVEQYLANLKPGPEGI